MPARSSDPLTPSLCHVIASSVNHTITRLSPDAAKRPDLTVRTAQMLLDHLGYHPHGVDGSTGAHTLTALHNFQCAQGQSLSTEIDDGVVASLQAAMPAAVALSFAYASAGRTV